VIVGGNSILHGTGQRAAEVWTRHLQEQLGDDYRVVNLGVRGAFTHEFGAVVAEIIGQTHGRVLFVTCFGGTGPSFEEGNFYRYLFWDAYHRGLLRKDPEREEHLRHVQNVRGKDPVFAEMQLQVQVDRLTSSCDLWTAAAYKVISTTWSPLVSSSILRARKQYPDPEVGPLVPFELRYPPQIEAVAMEQVRGGIRWKPSFEGAQPHAARALRAWIPGPDRKRTLVLCIPENPYYVRRLGSVEQAQYAEVFTMAAASFEWGGFTAMEVCKGYSVDDYFDRVHLSEQGGRRLAGEVAPRLRRMARELGYLK
jgi:hypothetical protein